MKYIQPIAIALAAAAAVFLGGITVAGAQQSKLPYNFDVKISESESFRVETDKNTLMRKDMHTGAVVRITALKASRFYVNAVVADCEELHVILLASNRYDSDGTKTASSREVKKYDADPKGGVPFELVKFLCSTKLPGRDSLSPAQQAFWVTP